jgi:hypothetical protein
LSPKKHLFLNENLIQTATTFLVYNFGSYLATKKTAPVRWWAVYGLSLILIRLSPILIRLSPILIRLKISLF